MSAPWMQLLLEGVQGMGIWGPFALGGLYVLACVLCLPCVPLGLGAGFLFGVWIGFPVVSAASTMGAAAAFLIGRTLLRGRVERRARASAPFAAIDEAVGRAGFRVVFLLRLSPVLPFGLLHYVLGVTRIRFGSYLLASWLGMIPGTLLFVYMGAAARSLAEAVAVDTAGSTAGQAMLVAGLAATACAAILLMRLARRALAEAGLGKCDRGGEGRCI